MAKPSLKCLKILKTCNLYLTVFVLGMCAAIEGPCLLDLQHIVSTDAKHISFVYTARSSGFLVGSLIGGVVLDLAKSRLAVLSFCTFILTGTLLAIPWSRSIEVLVGFIIVKGLFCGALDTGCNVVCLNLWEKNSRPIFQGLHLFFGLGGLVSPLIAAPYLGDYRQERPSDNITHLNETFKNSTSKIWTNSFSTDTNLLHSNSTASDIIYPFSYIGAFCFIASVSLLVVCFLSPTEEVRKSSDNKDNSSRSLLFLIIVVSHIFFLIVFESGMEIGYGQMLTTFAVKGHLHVSATVASYITSAFWASFTVARLASVFLAIKFKYLILMTADLTLSAIAALVLLFLMPNEWALWVATVVFGAGIASFYPSAVGWLSEHIYLTSKIASIFTVGAASGEMLVPFIISYFTDTVPDIFSYAITAACVSTSIMVFSLYMFFKKYDKRDVKLREQEI